MYNLSFCKPHLTSPSKGEELVSTSPCEGEALFTPPPGGGDGGGVRKNVQPFFFVNPTLPPLPKGRN